MPNTISMPVPQQYLDHDGNPLAFGKVYTYQVETTKPLVTYTEVTEDNANTNPVILDAAGRAHIWSKQAVKVVVKSAKDVTVIVKEYEGTSYNFDDLQNKPTTTAGYGITSIDYQLLQNRPNTTTGLGITNINNPNVVNRPTTLEGYGITDYYDTDTMNVGKHVILRSPYWAEYQTPTGHTDESDWFQIKFNDLSGQFIDSFISDFVDYKFYLDAGTYRVDIISRYSCFGFASTPDLVSIQERITDTTTGGDRLIVKSPISTILSELTSSQQRREVKTQSAFIFTQQTKRQHQAQYSLGAPAGTFFTYPLSVDMSITKLA